MNLNKQTKMILIKFYHTENYHHFQLVLLRTDGTCFCEPIQCPYSTDLIGNSITFDRNARSLNNILRLKRQSKQIFTMFTTIHATRALRNS